MLRVLLLVLAAILGGSLRAHDVPQIIIEAEFTTKREASLKVNIDPRLFLSLQPTSLPPVPASWWFDQDEPAREKTRRAAADYVTRTFTLKVGTEPLKTDWKVQAIDSTSYFPLGQASSETHLLVEHRGPLPDNTGDFKVLIAKDCAVPVILLCSNTGDAERRPQSLFGGESSRPFPLPALPTGIPSSTDRVAPGGKASQGGIRPFLAEFEWFLRHPHFIGDHLALAALLGFALWRRWWLAPGLLLAFHAVDRLATCLVITGWLPPAPFWMTVAYWMALALTVVRLLLFKSKDASLFLPLAVAGLCHGLNASHLHLDLAAQSLSLVSSVREGSVLLLLELTVLFACALLVRLLRRRPSSESRPTTA